MRFGVCAWSFSDAHRQSGQDPDPWTLAGLFAIARRDGLDAVEVSSAAVKQAEPTTRAEVKAAVDDGFAVIVDNGGETPEQLQQGLHDALEAAEAIGASVVRTTISRCLEGDRSRFGREGWLRHLEEVVDPLRQAAKQAESLGVALGVENHQDISSRELVQLCETVDSPAFGVVMDCGNALAVGEPPAAFARRVRPFLKHVHLKDYVVHATPSGWRLARCPLGAGVVDFPDLVRYFDRATPSLIGCIELGATKARHIRLLGPEWWSTFESRPWDESIRAIQELHEAQQPLDADWRTPHERGADATELVAYERSQYETSVGYLAELTEAGLGR